MKERQKISGMWLRESPGDQQWLENLQVPGTFDLAEKVTDKGSGSRVATIAASSRACRRSFHAFTLGSECTSDFPKTISKFLPV